MNKHLKRFLIIFLALIVCVICFTGFTTVKRRTLSSVCEIDSVFIPKGMANKYENNYMFNDGTITWIYKLGHKEQTEIEAEIENWTLLKGSQKADVLGIIEHYSDIDTNKMSNELYVKNYNATNSREIEPDASCLNTFTFIYDKPNGIYYCFLIEI